MFFNEKNLVLSAKFSSENFFPLSKALWETNLLISTATDQKAVSVLGKFAAGTPWLLGFPAWTVQKKFGVGFR